MEQKTIKCSDGSITINVMSDKEYEEKKEAWLNSERF